VQARAAPGARLRTAIELGETGDALVKRFVAEARAAVCTQRGRFSS
jgi:hypothetical protein